MLSQEQSDPETAAAVLGVPEARTAKEMTCAYCPMRTSHTCRAVYNTEWQMKCIGQMVDISRDNIVQGMEAVTCLTLSWAKIVVVVHM